MPFAHSLGGTRTVFDDLRTLLARATILRSCDALASIAASTAAERVAAPAQDSMGNHLARAPRQGRTDAERHCISNIRPGGMSAGEAAAKLAWLLHQAMGLGATGVALKDDMQAAALAGPVGVGGLLGATSAEDRQTR